MSTKSQVEIKREPNKITGTMDGETIIRLENTAELSWHAKSIVHTNLGDLSEMEAMADCVKKAISASRETPDYVVEDKTKVIKEFEKELMNLKSFHLLAIADQIKPFAAYEMTALYDVKAMYVSLDFSFADEVLGIIKKYIAEGKKTSEEIKKIISKSEEIEHYYELFFDESFIYIDPYDHDPASVFDSWKVKGIRLSDEGIPSVCLIKESNAKLRTSALIRNREIDSFTRIEPFQKT